MNVLCVCQYGHSRSVALARALHARRIPAVACGWLTAGTGLAALAAWADRIAVLEPGYAAHVPADHRAKIIVIDVGPDRWSNPYHPELAALVDRLAHAAGLFET